MIARHLDASRLRNEWFDAMVAVERARGELRRGERTHPLTEDEARDLYELRETIHAAEHMIRQARTFADVEPTGHVIEFWNAAVELLEGAIYDAPRF